MTVKRILKEIEARIALLEKRRNVLEDRLLGFRHSKPYRGMTDRELNGLPRASRFWIEHDRKANQIAAINREIYKLRDMLYGYRQCD